jgi:hypothetical protein
MTTIENCSHQNTVTQAGVSETQNRRGKRIGFQLTARVHCADCGVVFHFPGLPVCGDVAKVPSANNDATVLVVPMQPGAAPVKHN